MVSTEPADDLVDTAVSEVAVAVEAVQWFSQAARELQEADGWHDTVQRMVDLAAGLVEADLAVIIGLSPTQSQPRVLAATDFRRADALLAAQNESGIFASWQAMIDKVVVHVPDLSDHASWPALRQHPRSPMLRAVVAFPLLIDDQPQASLGLYARHPGAFSTGVLALAAAFAEHATTRTTPRSNHRRSEDHPR